MAFLDHDDTLAEHALYMMAAAIDEYPDAAVIYSDEDTIDHLGRPLWPMFKPAWGDRVDQLRDCVEGMQQEPNYPAIELMRVRNVAALTRTCLVLSGQVLEGIGGFDEGLAVAYWDIDLCLKLRAAGYWLVFTLFAELIHDPAAASAISDVPKQWQQQQCDANYLTAQ